MLRLCVSIWRGAVRRCEGDLTVTCQSVALLPSVPTLNWRNQTFTVLNRPCTYVHFYHFKIKLANFYRAPTLWRRAGVGGVMVIFRSSLQPLQVVAMKRARFKLFHCIFKSENGANGQKL